jgi:hypothetical protein
MGPLMGAAGAAMTGRAMICIPQRIEITLIAEGYDPEVDTVCY